MEPWSCVLGSKKRRQTGVNCHEATCEMGEDAFVFWALFRDGGSESVSASARVRVTVVSGAWVALAR